MDLEVKQIKVLFFALLLLIAQSFAFVSVCKVSAQQTGGTLHVAMSLEPDTFNVYVSTLAIEDIFINAFYDTLAAEGMDFQIHPKLAVNWTASTDKKVWTVRIVDNATFHDGTRVTADDVKYSYDLAQMDVIDDIEVVDNTTLKFHFKEAYVEDYVLRSVFAGYYAKILPKHIWQTISDPYSYRNTNPVGSGPWIMDQWVEGQYIKIKANPNYWGGKPYLDYVVFDIIPTADAQVLALLSGTVDILYSVDPSYVSSIIGQPNINITIRDQLTRSYIAFNLRRYPFNVRDFRYAIAYAIDTAKLVRDVLYGYGSPGTQGWCSPATPIFYNPNICKYEYNVTRANEILDDLGWARGTDDIRSTENGTRLEFDYISWSDPVSVRTAEFIRDCLQDIGVKLNIKSMESKSAISKMLQFDYFLGQMQWFSISLEPSVDMLWHFLPNAFFNVYGYNNTEYNQIFEEFKVATSFDDYKQKIFRLQTILSEDLPIFIYSFGKSINAYRTDKFEGWIIPDVSDDMFQGLVNWWSFQQVHLKQTQAPPPQQVTIPEWVWIIVGVSVTVAVISIGYTLIVVRRKK